jgi:glycosyltransferase involved in cell wall biosynthesis
MDNGSTDRTHQILENLGYTFHVLLGVNVSTLRNRGAAIANGDFLAFVDADVELAWRWRDSLSVFTDRSVVATGCFPGVPKDATWVQQTWDLHQRRRDASIGVRPAAWLSSMNLIVRRESFIVAGGFNEQLITAEDVDMCYRLGRCGTILYNSAVAAVHWGEAKDLKRFWQKEVWRGLGNLRGLKSHGFRWDELPSLGYPGYMGLVVILFVLGIGIDMSHRQFLYTPFFVALLVLPPFLLALHTAAIEKNLWALFRLFILYLVYGLARAYAMVKPQRG